MATATSSPSVASSIRPLGRPGDLGWAVMANGAVYAEEFGWDTTFEALAARIVADFAGLPDDEFSAGWIAELDGERVGCVLCVPAEGEGTAKLRLLLVHPEGRGHGLGSRLVESAVQFARSAGYTRMVLWTNHPLASARRIYLAQGFRLVAEEPHHSFGVDLVGQTYLLEFAGGAEEAS